MTLGIGLYAPCMIHVSLLGWIPRWPFRSDSDGLVAFLMPVGSVRSSARALRAAGRGGPGRRGSPTRVLLAAYVVRSLPLGAGALAV